MVIFAMNGNAYAEDYSVVQGYMHTFNNGIDVYSGVFALNKDLSLQTSSYLKYTVDLINPSFGGGGEGGGGGDDAVNGNAHATSGASSAVSSSGSNSKDTRHGFTAGVTHNFNNIIGVEAYIDYSKEKDYKSTTPTLTLKKDFNDKNTTLTAGYSRNFDTVHGQFMDNREKRNTNNYFVGLTQVISPMTVAQIGYSRSNSSGAESEGIRLVPINGVAASTCTAKGANCLAEAFPDKRTRNAYLAGVNHYFLTPGFSVLNKSSVKFNFRYYTDDWKIKSYMGETEWSKYLSGHTLLRLDYRYYNQTKAYFQQDNYTAADALRSASPQLKSFSSNLAGVKLTYFLKDAKGAPSFMKQGSVEGKYEFYTQSLGVNAHVLMAGLRIPF
ncbi:MAG: DUF3570 domain-containing protein [Deltaproteobacteria bacterium]|nr:DUF3570 domain-containing protein [Deltaproteobacteria bacterium]